MNFMKGLIGTTALACGVVAGMLVFSSPAAAAADSESSGRGSLRYHTYAFGEEGEWSGRENWGAAVPIDGEQIAVRKSVGAVWTVPMPQTWGQIRYEIGVEGAKVLCMTAGPPGLSPSVTAEACRKNDPAQQFSIVTTSVGAESGYSVQ